MGAAIAREIRDGDRVGVGVNSPVPASAVLLARMTHAPNAVLRLPGAEAGTAFLGSKEFFDMAQRGRIDVFFHSGVQIDRRGRLNLHALGDYAAPRRRFPGAFGSAVLYPVIPRVILFRLEHSPRALVENVDFVTAAPGPQGPDRLVTPRGVLTWDAAADELVLAEVAPGETVESVRAATGWDLRVRDDVHELAPPTDEEVRMLRGPVLDMLAGAYPRYVEARRG